MAVIAIDGPAASGKGTLARRIAQEFGYHHLDTGLTYRAVAKSLLDQDMPLGEVAPAVSAAQALAMEDLDRVALAAHHVGEAASKIAVLPAVRRILVGKQRDFAGRPPGAVLDGRDIGTVVCPDAAVKLYVTATPDIRARRRYEETTRNGQAADFDDILADIRRRDARDMERADSPLKPAPDAHLLDTSEMDIETAFKAALAIIDRSGCIER